jgi:hypothetical protein
MEYNKMVQSNYRLQFAQQRWWSGDWITIIIIEIKNRRRKACVHDDKVGEHVGDILDSSETNKTTPILTDKGHLGDIQMIQKFPQYKAMHLMSVVVWICIFVRFSKT